MIYFTQEEAEEMAWDGDIPEGVEIVENEQIDSGRWESVHSLVISKDGKFYKATYNKGLTESQENSMFERCLEEKGVPFNEVFRKEKTVFYYG